MAQVTTYITNYGSKLMAQKGLVNTLAYWSISDADRNYAITAEQNVLPHIAGLDTLSTKTNSYCGIANYDGMMTNPTQGEIRNLIQSGLLTFYKVDCDDEFSTPQLTINFNVMRWLNELSLAITNGYSFNMEATTQKTIWDYFNVTVREKDILTNNYKNVSETTDFDISYVPRSKQDMINYRSISPLYITTNGDGRKLYNGIGNGRFTSPLRVSFVTSEINGKVIDGISSVVTLAPDYWGYKTNLGFINDLISVEQNTDLYSEIYPAVSIGGKIFYLNNNTLYNTKSQDRIGYLLNFFDDEGKSALQELIDRTYLYFKTAGNLIDDKYYIPLNFDIRLTGKNINGLDIFGNQVKMNFILDPSDIMSTEIIELV